MTSILIAFLVVLLLPLFMASWRTSLLGLCLQGLLMGWILYRREPLTTPEAMVHMVDLVVVRGFLVPFLLYRILVAHQSQRRNDVIPPNMLSWTAVGILVAIAFHAAGTLVPSEPGQQMHVAVAASSLLLGFFVLATQDGPFSQAVGALRIEYAVALFELASRGRGVPLALYVGQAIVFVLTISTYAVYVRLLHPGAPAIPPSEQPIL